jgi:hypothetical protein
MHLVKLTAMRISLRVISKVKILLVFSLRLDSADLSSSIFHPQTQQRRPIGRLYFNLSSCQPAPRTCALNLKLSEHRVFQGLYQYRLAM